MYPLQHKSLSARENCKGTVPSVYLSVWGGGGGGGEEGFHFVPPLDCTAKHMKEMSTTCLYLPKSFFLFSHCLFPTLCPFLLSSSHPLSRVNEWEVAMLEVYNDSVLQKHKGPSCELMLHHFRQTALNKGPALHSPRLTKRSAVKPWMQLKNRRERGWC